MTIEKFNTEAEPRQSNPPYVLSRFFLRSLILIVRFHLRQKKSQIKSLRRFARTLKWPNLQLIDTVLKETDPDAKPLEDRSSDAMSYFTGVILPGTSLPWLLMNTLI